MTKNPFFQAKYILISFILSFSGLAVVLYFTYSPGLFSQMEFRRLPGLIIALGFTLLRLYLSAQKLRFLSDTELSLVACLRITLAWDFASAVTPSTVGGAPAAIFAMGKEKLNMGKTTAITIYGVLLDQIWFVVAIPILLLFGFVYDIIPENAGKTAGFIMVLIYSVLLIYAALLTYGTLINPKSISKVIRKIVSIWFLKKYENRVHQFLDEMIEHSNLLRGKPFQFLAKAFFISTFAWLSRIAVPVAVILSFGQSDVVLSILRSLALHLTGLFIPTPGGSGGLEGLFALFMGTIMPRKGFIALAIFMWRFIGYYITAGLGAWSTLWYLEKRNLIL